MFGAIHLPWTQDSTHTGTHCSPRWSGAYPAQHSSTGLYFTNVWVLKTSRNLILYFEHLGGTLKHHVYSFTWYGCFSDTRIVVVYLKKNITYKYQKFLARWFLKTINYMLYIYIIQKRAYSYQKKIIRHDASAL